MIEYTWYLLIGAALFILGLIGFVVRRNLILIFLCTELMLQGVILTLVAFNHYWLVRGGAAGPLEGHAFVIFLLVIAAAEAALAMALVMALQHQKCTLDADAFTELKG
jgi:NADH-quinone oxidoreductase subunit K